MISRDKFFTHSIILMSPQVFHLLFKALMVNWLPKDYSVLGALIAVLAIMATPLSAAQTWASYQVSRLRVENRQAALNHFVRRSLVVFALIGAGAAGIGVLFGLAVWGVSSAVNVQTTLIFSAAVAFVIFSPLLNGLLQGMQKYVVFAMYVLVFSCSKVGFGGLFIGLGMEVVGGVLAILCAHAVGAAMVVLYVIARSNGESVETKSDAASPHLGYLGYSVVALSSVALLFFADEVLIRLRNPAQADLFSAAKIVGLIFIYVPMPLIASMFPKVTEAYARGRSTVELLVKCLIFSAFLCAALLLLAVAFPSLVGVLTNVKKYEDVVSLSLLYSLAIIPVALTNVVVQYGLARARRRFLFVLVPYSLVHLFLVYWFSYDVFVVTRVIGIFALLTAGAVCFAVLKDRKNDREADDAKSPEA